jgi:uncharacterized membrane protein
MSSIHEHYTQELNSTARANRAFLDTTNLIISVAGLALSLAFNYNFTSWVFITAIITLILSLATTEEAIYLEIKYFNSATRLLNYITIFLVILGLIMVGFNG